MSDRMDEKQKQREMMALQEAEWVLFENEMEIETRANCDAWVLAHPWRTRLVLVKRWWARQRFLK
jgi:hypothetical protein